VTRSAPGLKSLSALGALRSLRLRWHDREPAVSHRELLSTFTMLTSLVLVLDGRASGGTTLFPGLARLTGLSHLEVTVQGWDMTRGDLARVSSLTKLTSLCLLGSHLAGIVGGSSALLPLTGLVSMGLNYCSHMSRLPSLNVEALQSLTLHDVRHDVSVLRRASGLTQLDLRCFFNSLGEYPDELGHALAGMPRLCSLSLHMHGRIEGGCRPGPSPILRASACLTRLKCSGDFGAVDPDIQACLSLPRLRSLVLCYTPEVTDASLPALQAMTGLTELVLEYTGIPQCFMTPDVRAAFDEDRLRRGWPRSKLYLQACPTCN
jgi:hypothetical protein